MIIDVAAAKNYIRVDGNDDNDLIELQIGAAEEFIKNGTGKSLDWLSTNKIAKLFCLMLVQNMYDKRTYTVSINENISKAAAGFILQLKYCYEETEEPTE